MNETAEMYKRAHTRVKKCLSFYRNLIGFVIIITALIIINLLTSPGHLWFYWPMLGWGIGLAFQAFSTFSNFSPIAGEWEEKKLRNTWKRTSSWKWLNSYGLKCFSLYFYISAIQAVDIDCKFCGF